MYQGIVEANRPLEEVVSMPEMLEGRYSLEEGDPLVLFNAFDVMQNDPDCKLDVFFCRYRCVCSSCRTLPTHSQVSYSHH